ncbi:hypothetical protein PHSY_002939 [Pseudozyma hubeiensis SY62]|uniref:Uncharacterized protein n=1 Tax=Pseudozyma hubeiensis (strain SY62) TaxID=1305764 RepID=R9P2A4_PSEHS|nr:hypothetical protein PHSY_002939 [Pseudozyma hubeiensis SY62]GAC95364.1 hypothetical protein PHSY_002939 [Pseudozyma hubeiensis SY62]
MVPDEVAAKKELDERKKVNAGSFRDERGGTKKRSTDGGRKDAGTLATGLGNGVVRRGYGCVTRITIDRSKCPQDHTETATAQRLDSPTDADRPSCFCCCCCCYCCRLN